MVVKGDIRSENFMATLQSGRGATVTVRFKIFEAVITNYITFTVTGLTPGKRQ